MAKAKNDIVTKRYLDKRLSRFKDEIKEDIIEQGQGLKNDLYEIKDEIVGEIKAMREEFNIHQASHIRINDELRDHEKRIVTLENPM